ncbi:MAG: 6-carboxytetrahydropterin synthase [Elusimicrobia bacterium]|nr:6-carboxytetrahydropterin synthase [Elusimicrobiota bacterium]
MYEIIVEGGFSGAHALKLPGGRREPLHGHNWRVQVVLRGRKLHPKAGYLVDFTHVQAVLNRLLAPFDHHNLNETVPFDRLNPSAENLAKFLSDHLQAGLKATTLGQCAVAKVTVWETDTTAAAYLTHV